MVSLALPLCFDFVLVAKLSQFHEMLFAMLNQAIHFDCHTRNVVWADDSSPLKALVMIMFSGLPYGR